MWIVEAPSPASSGPPTPAMTPAVLIPPQNPLSLSNSGNASLPSSTPSATGPPYTTNVASGPGISAANLPGASLSGRLTGVISLTDILNLFARATGLHPHDPAELRRQRRRSSSSSMRRSVESNRSESIGASSVSGDLSRRGSISGRR